MTTSPYFLDRRQLFAAVGAVAASGMTPGLTRAQTPAAFPASTTLLERGIADKRYPGVVAAFGAGGDAPTFVSRGTQAFDSPTPVGPDTLWRVYSMTKPVVGMAIMLLIDEGRIKLDQPVADFVPAFAKARVLTDPESLASRPVERPLTIRHLLTHTGGLGSAGSLPNVMPPKLLEAYTKANLSSRRADGKPGPSLAEFADRLATLPLLTEPGARWNYSLSIDLLGRIIEVASGQPFDAFLQARFFKPLTMASTGFTVASGDAQRLAANYVRTDDKLTLLDPGPTSAYLKPPSFPSGGGFK